MSEQKPPEGPLLVHDRSLTGKVALGSEAGEIVDQQLLLLGTQLVTQLNVLLRTVRSHGSSNAALERPVAAIRTLVRTLGNDQPVALRVQEGFIFLGERHLRTTTQQLPIFASFFDALASLGIGGVVLRSTGSESDLRRFAELFVATTPGEFGIDDLRAKLAEARIESIALEVPRAARKSTAPTEGVSHAGPGSGSGTADARAHVRERARSAYARAGAALATLNDSARAGGRINFRQAKRAIQNIIDLLLKDPATVLGLTTLRAHDEYTQNHSVNVALLAMALGNRAGYPKLELAEVGLAGLFHDVGKCAVPLSVLNKAGDFTAEEWEVMQTHPSEGVLALVGMRGLSQVPMRMAAAAFEHHLNLDGSGYPRLLTPWSQTLASRVVTIADCYDAMTSARVYRREPMPPPAVLAFMMARAGSAFDAVLLKHFITCVGIVPIGTLVLLDSDELAVVLRPATEKEHVQRPVVRIIADAAGNPLAEARELDLREKDGYGEFRRTIVRLVDNTTYHLDTSRYVCSL